MLLAAEFADKACNAQLKSVTAAAAAAGGCSCRQLLGVQLGGRCLVQLNI